MTEETTRDLSNKLNDLWSDLKSGKVDAKTGNAMAKVAMNIIEIAQLEIETGAIIVVAGPRPKKAVVYDPASQDGNPRYK